MSVPRPVSALFTAVHYGITVPLSDLPDWAAREDYNPDGPTATEAECRAALADCLANGWLQVLDEPALATIADELREGGVLGPIYGGLPPVGCVDFTTAGVAVWRRLHDGPANRRLACAYTDVVGEKTARYYRTRAAAVAAVEEARGESEVVAVTGPTPTGLWRAQWWRRQPEGYRIDVEERWRWQGRGSGGGESCHLVIPAGAADPRRLRHAIDRHNVTAAEWLLLAAMECDWSCDTAAGLTRYAATLGRRFGLSATDDEYRGALENCLRYGWLRVVDRDTVEEVRTLLRRDPAFLAIPLTAEKRPKTCCYQYRAGKMIPAPWPSDYRCGVFDFSPNGAALYRTVAADWLGPAWEDGLAVENTYCWEEHHYCVAEEGFEGIVEKHLAEGTAVRANRVVPIGPWCVHWWERFPAGYRLELELGQS
ncbi:MAG: hypothetical protein U0746_18645 [Gemmataceae bacterium]